MIDLLLECNSSAYETQSMCNTLYYQNEGQNPHDHLISIDAATPVHDK